MKQKPCSYIDLQFYEEKNAFSRPYFFGEIVLLCIAKSSKPFFQEKEMMLKIGLPVELIKNWCAIFK